MADSIRIAAHKADNPLKIAPSVDDEQLDLYRDAYGFQSVSNLASKHDYRYRRTADAPDLDEDVSLPAKDVTTSESFGKMMEKEKSHIKAPPRILGATMFHNAMKGKLKLSLVAIIIESLFNSIVSKRKVEEVDDKVYLAEDEDDLLPRKKRSKGEIQ